MTVDAQTDDLRLLTVPQVAEMLAISKSHVHALRATGKLKFIKIGRSTRYDPADIKQFIEDQKMLIR